MYIKIVSRFWILSHVVTRSFLRISVYLFNKEKLKVWSGRARWSAGALDKMTRSAGALDKTELERGAERGVGALERWWKIGRSAGALTKKGRSAGALIPLYGPRLWVWCLSLTWITLENKIFLSIIESSRIQVSIFKNCISSEGIVKLVKPSVDILIFIQIFENIKGKFIVSL